MALITLFMGLEILIAYLQAYIFTFITCITLKDMGYHFITLAGLAMFIYLVAISLLAFYYYSLGLATFALTISASSYLRPIASPCRLLVMI